ncbi:VTT domain-containing protein [Rhizobium sp. BK418]|uniref:DedA family protein n=1 Tax=Rhizobium sp. BK418 TaxID=2512120 RepID=UPI001043AD4C|nr:VTT domain-containing protein [Rhizobium sp. BK418]TCS03051.1 SNARE associated Golgi protein [Rhizobium sp. BK418]
MVLPNFVTCLLATGLGGVMIVAMLEKLVPVVPSVGLYLLFGLTAGSEFSAVMPLIVISAFGSMSGSLCWYYLARFSGAHPQLRLLSNWLGRFAAVRQASSWYSESVTRMALVQLVPAARVYSALASAVVTIDVTRFAIATFIGCLIWNGTLIFAGWMVRHL